MVVNEDFILGEIIMIQAKNLENEYVMSGSVFERDDSVEYDIYGGEPDCSSGEYDCDYEIPFGE